MEFTKQRAEIVQLAQQVADDLAAYEEERNRKRGQFLASLKALRHTLRATEQKVIKLEQDTCRKLPDVSEASDCFFCNGHYALASEHAWGIRYEPIPGQGYVFICWECVFALAEVIDRQRNGLAYTFLFSRTKETRELARRTVQPVEMAEP